MGVNAAQCRSPTQVSRGFRGQRWSWPVWLCGQGKSSAWGQDTCPGSVASPQPSSLASFWERSGGCRAGGGGEASGPLGCWQFQGKGQDSLARERKQGREQCKDES